MMQNPVSDLRPSEEDKKLLAESAGKRISAVMRNGERVWIKRHDCERVNWGRKLHAFISPMLPAAHFLRAAPLRTAEALAAQEVRKTLAFKAAGMQTPDIICLDGPALILSDVHENLQKRLKRERDQNPHLHDGLLIQCSEALGEAHAAGLCHGRPHPRDMFVANGKIGFFDFEEEPEAVMSLAQAQARDAWLLFFQISTQALETERTPNAAFSAWRRHISLDTLQSLKQLVRFFRFCVIPLKIARPIWLGDDGKRMLNAMEFFISHLGLKAKL